MHQYRWKSTSFGRKKGNNRRKSYNQFKIEQVDQSIKHFTKKWKTETRDIRDISGTDTEDFSEHTNNIMKARSIHQIKKILKIRDDFDTNVYTVAIQQAGLLGNTNYCIQIMDLLYRRSIIPNEITFNTLFHAFILHNRLSLCYKYLDPMINKYQLKPDIITVTALLKNCTDIAQSEQIKSELIEKYGLKPGILIYETIIKIYGQNGNSDNVKDICNEMIKNTEEHGAIISPVTAHILLRSYISYYGCKHDEVVQFFQKLCELKIIGYFSEKGVIDLHGYAYEEIEFVLFYLLHFKVNELIDVMGYNWIIICGKTVGNDANSKQFIINELDSKYSICSDINSKNPGTLMLNTQGVKEFTTKFTAE